MKSCIILDDPILRKNYGFINFRKLLKLMDKHDFHTTVAFIPWNYKRTDKKIAQLFRERPDRFSLCIHGCDHTKGEWTSVNEGYLNKISKLALFRVEKHVRFTGIPCAPVIVFPHGLFSNKALDVLFKNGYRAAINTEVTPADGSEIKSRLPFYRRFKPNEVPHPFPNPLFIVLHHDYFRNGGYERLGAFVDYLNSQAKIEWASVGNILNAGGVPVSIGKITALKAHGIKKATKIMVRRLACDIRDNIVMRIG